MTVYVNIVKGKITNYIRNWLDCDFEIYFTNKSLPYLISAMVNTIFVLPFEVPKS